MATEAQIPHPKDLAGMIMLCVTMLAAGMLVGVYYTARTALTFRPEALGKTRWLAHIETMQYALFGVAVVGFGALLLLQYTEE